MWLDRFSGYSTPTEPPSTPSRSYSPAPRRSSHLAPSPRNVLGQNRGGSTISLDLSPSVSRTSLTANGRLVNGSSLRQEEQPPSDVADPLDVLRSILGKPIAARKADSTHEAFIGKPATIVEDIDFGNLSLEEYLTRAPTQPSGPAGKTEYESTTATEDRKKYEELHDSIQSSDDVLKSVESYLTNFQAELGAVSAEIENLQSRSTQLSAKLDNRRKVEKLLGPAVEDITISPMTVLAIFEGSIDESWVKALNEIETRSVTIEAKASTSEPIKALEDVKPLLDDLKAKAIERIRDFIVTQVKALRSPSINAHILQQQFFIPYKGLYAFLARHHPVLAEEIGQAYIYTMRWYYSSNFVRYQQGLEKLQLHVIDQYDLLGADPSASRRTGAKAPLPQHDTFNLGRRENILQNRSSSAISSFLAEEDKSPHYIETPFQNFNLALVDNVCAEYSVVTELFTTKTFQQVTRKVAEIFEPTFILGHNLTRQLVEHSADCLGVLLCVRLNQQFAFELQRRKVPVADSYINGTNMLLWPRFQKIMDLHCESLKRIATASNRGAAAAFSLVGGNDPSRISLAPHAVTQRFGQFLHGILVLSSDASDDEPVSNSLIRLRGEFEALMAKLAKGVGDATKRARFLFNNYSLVSTIISDTHGKLADEQKSHLEGLVKNAKAK